MLRSTLGAHASLRAVSAVRHETGVAVKASSQKLRPFGYASG